MRLFIIKHMKKNLRNQTCIINSITYNRNEFDHDSNCKLYQLTRYYKKKQNEPFSSYQRNIIDRKILSLNLLLFLSVSI